MRISYVVIGIVLLSFIHLNGKLNVLCDKVKEHNLFVEKNLQKNTLNLHKLLENRTIQIKTTNQSTKHSI